MLPRGTTASWFPPFFRKEAFLMMKKLSVLLLAALLLVSCALAEETRYTEVFDTSADAGKLTIRFLWLGEQTAKDKPGDCMILTSPEGKVMVLDAGHPDASQYVVDALNAMGVTKIDYLVASHPHIDHIGGFPRLIENYEIGALYTSALTYESSSYYNAYLASAKEAGLEHIILGEGDVLMFGDEVQIEVLNPPHEITYPDGYPNNSTQFVNNQSLALKLTYGTSTIMLAGDLYVGGEKDVATRHGDALDCDVMKVNHHGANTSSSSTWRNAVSPMISFITSDTIEDLTIAKKYIKGDQKMYHTLLDGCIRMQTPGDSTYDVLTEKDRTTTMFD